MKNVINNMTSGTTAVPEKDIPDAPVPTFHNAPTTIEEAVARIMEVEMRLEDLSRAVEIAGITRRFEILDGFREQADLCLEKKILIEQPDHGELKINVLVDGTEA